MRIYRCAARPSEDGAVAFAQGAFLGGTLTTAWMDQSPIPVYLRRRTNLDPGDDGHRWGGLTGVHECNPSGVYLYIDADAQPEIRRSST